MASSQVEPSPQPVILGLLMIRPQHGYELYQTFRRELGAIWRIGMSQLYAQLRQMESAGWVSAEIEPQTNRPTRKRYHVTPQGENVFLEWVHQPTSHLRYIRLEFLARLYFFRSLNLPHLDRLVTRQKDLFRQRADALAQSAAQAAAQDTQGFRRLVLEFRQGQYEAVLRWLDRCLEVL